MTKEELRQHREDIHGLRLEIYQIIESTNVMRSSAMRTTTKITDEPKGSGQIQDSMAEIIARVVDKEQQVQRLVMIQDKAIQEVEQDISGMAPRERAIFRCYYIECLPWERVATLMNYSVSWILKIHGEELEKRIVKSSKREL